MGEKYHVLVYEDRTTEMRTRLLYSPTYVIPILYRYMFIAELYLRVVCTYEGCYMVTIVVWLMNLLIISFFAC